MEINENDLINDDNNGGPLKILKLEFQELRDRRRKNRILFLKIKNIYILIYIKYVCDMFS